MLRIPLFLILWNFLCSLPLTGQEYSYVNYNTREGLAGSVVYCAKQDQDGFMWFGTETGLSRFDGSRFKNFTTSDGLPDNEIIRLFIDSRNRVWIIPFKNSICYYWRGKIYNAQNDSLLKRLKFKAEIQHMTENTAGDIVILEMQAVTLIRRDGKVLNFDNIDGFGMVGAFWAGEIKDGSFGIAMSVKNSGSVIFQLKDDSLKILKKISSPGNKFHLFFYSDALEFYRKTDSFKITFPLTRDTVIFKIPDQFLSWERLDDSLIAFNSSKVEIYNFKRKKTQWVLLQGKRTSAVFIDREKNFWFATQGDGIYKLSSLEFQNYFYKEEQNTLPVFSVLKSGDSLVAGLNNLNLWIINTRTGAMENKILGSTISTQGRIMNIQKLPDGSLLAGTDESLIKINGHNQSKAKDVYTSVKSIHVSGDSIFVGQSIGALILNKDDLKTIDTIWWGRTTAVFEKNDRYYIGTLEGLHIINFRENQLALNDHLMPVMKYRISAICEDQSGNVWVATNGNGVVGFKGGRIFTSINKDSGLTSNICRSIFANGNDLWIGTEQGVNKVTVKNNAFRITQYSVFDGLVSNIINSLWVEGSMVYLATPKGISFFDESKVNTHSMCALKITAIQSAAHRWQFDTSGVVFPYNDRDIRIEFVGISFKSAGAIIYNYRLKGLRDEWQQTGDNFLNYAALPSGSYELELQAINKFGVSSKIVKLPFTIAKPFWETTWFRVLIIVLLGAAIWKFVHYRIQSERNKEAQKAATGRKMAELEQMALKAQMNPHFIFNCLHSIQQYVLDKDIKGANKFITDFARLIRLTLNISMQTKISLYEEINYLSTYLELEKARLEEKFDYAVDVSGDIEVDSSYIPAMILQPYVENCIRHGVSHRDDNNGLIKVAFCKDGAYLLCIVEDNGPGLSATIAMKRELKIAHESKGMQLTRNRIELLNKNFELPIMAAVEDIQNIDEVSGTRVTIRFPLEDAKKPV